MNRIATTQKVIVKVAPAYRLENEFRVLQAVGGNPCIRPLIETTKEPHSLVLRHLDDNLLDVSNTKRLEKADIKNFAHNMLTTIDALHGKGYVHTD